MKLDYRKMINDLKAQSYQQNRKRLNKENLRKRVYFQKIEQENLEKKKNS